MKKKEYKSPTSLVVPLPHIAVLNPNSPPVAPVDPKTGTGDAFSRQFDDIDFDDIDEEF